MQARTLSRIVSSLLFPCPAPSYTVDSFPGELIWIPRGPTVASDGGGGAGTGEPDQGDAAHGGETVPCLLLPFESAKYLLVFFHSNAEDLGRCRWFCHFLRDQFQVHVLAVEYPGYGICPGPPSREGVVANARAAVEFAQQGLRLPLDQIKVFGRSIGTGPALHVAARYRISGLILVTPFLSVRALFADRVGSLSTVVEEWFDNETQVQKVRCPTMFIHGRKDGIVPYRHGESLYKQCLSRKLLVNPASMEHNTNLTSDAAFLIVPMFRFFSLPDYSFQELKVPAWAFDKRRSPLYVRPAVEVCSSKFVPSTDGPGLATSVPAGDDEDCELEATESKARAGRVRSAEGDTPVVDLEKVAVLTQPTVRHLVRATKQRYAFEVPLLDTTSLTPGEGMEQHRAVTRQRALGDHPSASRPSAAPALALPVAVPGGSSPQEAAREGTSLPSALLGRIVAPSGASRRLREEGEGRRPVGSDCRAEVGMHQLRLGREVRDPAPKDGSPDDALACWQLEGQPELLCAL